MREFSSRRRPGGLIARAVSTSCCSSRASPASLLCTSLAFTPGWPSNVTRRAPIECEFDAICETLVM